MGNLIIDAGNYNTAINGKVYQVDSFACNYPISQSVFVRINVTFTQGSKSITTTGDFTELLRGQSLQNGGSPVFPYIVSENGEVLVVQNVLSPTAALLAIACPFANGVGTFSAVDLFGQPRVEQTYGIDATSGFAFTATFYSKYGASAASFGAALQPLGNEPILINLADYTTAGLNIQYSS
jgi:hypothetical protein